MKYGLLDPQFEEIIKIISSHSEIEEAVLFGSRAIDTFKEASDVDIALKGSKVNSKLAVNLQSYFEEETDLPYFFDFTSYSHIDSKDLKKHINKEGIVIYRKGWRTVKLGELIDVKHGYAFKGKYITNEPTNNILVTPGNFHIGGGFKASKFKYFNGNIPNNYILQENDLIITMTDLSKDSDTLGYAAKIPKGKKNEIYLHNQRIGLVQFKLENIDRNFIYWLIRTYNYHQFIVSSSSGTSIRHTSPERIKDYDFFLPPLSEQKAIAEVLSILDDKIGLLHEQNKTLEDMAQTLFHKWFIKEAKPTWEEKSLDEVLSVKGGTTPSTKNAQYWDGDILWTTPKDLSRNQHIYLFNTSKKITKLGLKQISSGLLPPGTLLLSSRAPIGYLAFSVYPISINQGYIAIIDDKGLSKEFIYLWLKTNMKYIKSYASGSTFLEINKSSFRKLKIELPPQKMRDTFCHLIEPIFQKIFLNSNQIRELEKLRDTLLPKLITGSIRVKQNV